MGAQAEVTVLFFAVLRDLTGAAAERVAVCEAATVADVLRELTQRHPRLEPHIGRIRVAKNEVFARENEPVRAGDTLALIPPVGGG